MTEKFVLCAPGTEILYAKAPPLLHLQDIRGELKCGPTSWKHRPAEKVKVLVLHCTDGWGDAKKVARYDVSPNNHITPGKPLPGITYSFFIDYPGTVLYTSDITNKTFHVGNWNKKSLGIVLRYRATRNSDPPKKEQLESTALLFANLCLILGRNPMKAVRGHRELYGTGWTWFGNGAKLKKTYRRTCPGWKTDLDQLRLDVVKHIQEVFKSLLLPIGKIDGIWGKKSKKCFKKYKKLFKEERQTALDFLC